MNDRLDPAQLREQFLLASDAEGARLLALVCSVTLVLTVLWLVRRRVLREEYTPIWMGVALGIAALSLVPPLLGWLTRAVGAWTPSSTLFFFGELFLLAICLNYAVRLSGMTLQIKNLAQELAVLRGELEAARDTQAGERSGN